MEAKRKIAAILVDRANYGRMKPVLLELRNREDIELQLICTGTMLLNRFGDASKIVENDGFEINGTAYIELEGSNPYTMSKTIGIGIMEFTNEFSRLKPDLVLIIGDRSEALAATISAVYMNICVAHIQGGEVSGSIDESARHAISKFSHYHFPSTTRSGDFLVRMGERPETVFRVGCPSSDIVLNMDFSITNQLLNETGIGTELDISKQFIMVSFHPTTTAYGSEISQIDELFKALIKINKQVVWLWPNIDAGSDNIAKFIRHKRENDKLENFRFVKNYPPEDYLKIMANAECLIGNSSSFVRDASFLGTPVILVGERQQGRECAENVIKVKPKEDEIMKAFTKHMKIGKYSPSNLYGEGNSSKLIVEKLADIKLYTQKLLGYVE